MIEKYKNTVIYLLIGVGVIISILLLDRWILPQKTIEDTLIGYRVLTSTRSTQFGTSKVYIADRYYTALGNDFTIDIDRPIKDTEITITQSMLFKNINTLKNQSHDYTNKLTSGFNGVFLLFTHIIACSILISLGLLMSNRKLSKNQFQNIILFNGFMIFITLYLWALYN
ncbi:hypothetical protein [Flavobacterium sp. HSC-61S13]|uniref:hypothetical protein n=1 Tax=Flavobacterium sp. HSC-61S13 TaxID=2910963 RepID=UPI00209F2894|nr:hypothetical protein [Flavobacterium sp. HSC-61S13]MCP1996476.1 hypothetical protein [Flavobacterium sp. HSC-61S13]